MSGRLSGNPCMGNAKCIYVLAKDILWLFDDFVDEFIIPIEIIGAWRSELGLRRLAGGFLRLSRQLRVIWYPSVRHAEGIDIISKDKVGLFYELVE